MAAVTEVVVFVSETEAITTVGFITQIKDLSARKIRRGVFRADGTAAQFNIGAFNHNIIIANNDGCFVVIFEVHVPQASECK